MCPECPLFLFRQVVLDDECTCVSSPFSNNPIVLGPDNANLPKIFVIIADGVSGESVKNEDACSKRLANVIRQVQVNLLIKRINLSPKIILTWRRCILSMLRHQDSRDHNVDLTGSLVKHVSNCLLYIPPPRSLEDCGRSVYQH